MNNKNVVPEAREGLNRFKMEAANEVGVNLKQGYNGDLTSKQAVPLSIMTPTRTVQFERKSRINRGHMVMVGYSFLLAM